MSTLLQVIIPVLELAKKSYSDLGVYATERKNDLTVNAASFPGLDPITGDLDAMITIYTASLTGPTEAKKQARKDLQLMLSQMAWSCALISGTDKTVFELSGFGMKTKGMNHNNLSAPTDFKFTDGPMPGTLTASFKGVPFKHAYMVYITTNPTDNNSWTTIQGDSASPVVIGDLASNTRYYGHVRAIGARGVMSPISNQDSRVTQ